MTILIGDPSTSSEAAAVVREEFRKREPEFTRLHEEGRRVMEQERQLRESIKDPYLRALAESLR